MKIIQNKIFIGIIFFLVINIFYIFSKGDTFLANSWDFYDSNVVWLKLMTKKKYLFANSETIIKEYMNIPRLSLGSELNVIVWLFILFEPFYALVLNQLLVQIISFLGIYLLSNRYIFKERGQWISFAIAFIFALLPFWQPGGIGAMGIPLLIYCFFEVLEYPKKYYLYLYLTLYPFYSNLFVFGIFSLFLLFSLLFLFRRKNYKRGLIILFFIGILYLVVEYRMFYFSFFNKNFVSHREEFFSQVGLRDAIKATINSFFVGQDHVPSLHQNIIIFSIIISLIMSLIKRDKYHLKILLFGLLLVAFIASFDGFYNQRNMSFFLSSISSIFTKFQTNRFYILYPTIWYTLFLFALRVIYSSLRKYKLQFITYILVVGQFFIVFKSNNIYKNLYDRYINTDQIYTFNEFYSEKAFKKISFCINRNEKVISLGIHPAVSAYNNLNTADGYSAIYPLSYKKKFRKIISKELDNNIENKDYFDNWGSRCYIFDDKLGTRFDITKYSSPEATINLELDVNALKSLSIGYIISTIPLQNKNRYNLVEKYSDNFRNYYLYKIIF